MQTSVEAASDAHVATLRTSALQSDLHLTHRVCAAVPTENPKCWLPPHVFACWPNTGAVLLDLKRNRYFGLGPDESKAMKHLLTHDIPHSDYSPAEESGKADLSERHSQIANELISAGLLVPNAPDRTIRLSSIDVDSTLTSIGYEKSRPTRVRPHHVFSHVRACFWAKRAIHIRSFYSVACEVSSFKERNIDAGKSVDVDALADLVCVFQRLRALSFTAKGQCLFHALALVKFLSIYRLFPTWVIGVTTTPWAAHSWVQHDRLILDSTPEHVCDFTPILAI